MLKKSRKKICLWVSLMTWCAVAISAASHLPVSISGDSVARKVPFSEYTHIYKNRRVSSTYPVEEQVSIQANSQGEKWVFNARNGGFAYAMNEGLKAATGDVLIAMNPDVKIKTGLMGMVNYLLSDASIGLIAPRIVSSNGVVQDGEEKYDTDRVLKVDWVIGAFMIMTRKSYEAVGGFDDGYFLYCEDMDLCKRMHQCGYSVVYYPDATIEYEGTRSARHSWKYARIFMMSLFRYWKKFGIK